MDGDEVVVESDNGVGDVEQRRNRWDGSRFAAAD